jgi:hypothetical protein
MAFSTLAISRERSSGNMSSRDETPWTLLAGSGMLSERSRPRMSATFFMTVVGSMPRSLLYSIWSIRRRSVMEIAARIESVIRSA